MPEVHVGYLDLDGRITRFQEARCGISEGQLDVEAEGPKCKLKLYGIPFPDAMGVADLAGKVFGPDMESVRDDPIAEGGIETRRMWLSYVSLMVRCKAFDSGSGRISVVFEGEVRDAETGFGGAIEGMVRCRVVERLW